MRLTTKGRFAVTAIIDLALHGGCGEQPVQLRDISLRQRISLSYLQQIFMALKKSNLVRSVRGPGGGYLLGREPERITVAEVFSCSGEKQEMMLCAGAENCSEGDKCMTHDLWKGLEECISVYLSQRTLADLIDNSEVVGAARRQQERFIRIVRSAAPASHMALETS